MPRPRFPTAAVRSLAAVFSIMVSATAHAQTVAVLWDALPSSAQVASYRVCIGTSSFSCDIHLAAVAASQTSFTFAPTGGMLHYVAITATNALGVGPWSSEVTFSIPAFTRPSDEVSRVGVPITPVQLIVEDPDGSPVNVHESGLPPGLALNPATRQITGTPLAVGTYNVTVLASDGLGTASQSWVWTIVGAGSDTIAPTLAITSHVSGETVGSTSVTISGIATDANRGGSGIAAVRVNGAAATGGSATGSNTANWSLGIVLAPGWNTIAVEAIDGAGNVTSQPITLTVTARACGSNSDFNRDCNGDVVWRNRSTGQNFVWYMDGGSVFAGASLPAVGDLTWQASASADINQDGSADLVWRNLVTGDIVVWFLNGTTIIGTAGLPTVSDLAWQLVASADVNRDGATDLLWRHRISGDNVVWYLSGTTVLGGDYFLSAPDSTWQLVASADMNQDGAPDLLWRNSVNGQNVIWYLSGTTLIGVTSLPAVADTEWRLVAAVDTNNDGAAELVWRHAFTGENVAWFVSQATVTGIVYLPIVPDLNWEVIGAR